MLCQLVCVDRRYQRMNCFNIRELQGILKRKFFTDLVNSNDHRNLFDKSIIGLRFKNNNQLNINHDMSLFYNFGTTTSAKTKYTLFSNNYSTFSNSSKNTSTMGDFTVQLSGYIVNFTNSLLLVNFSNTGGLPVVKLSPLYNTISNILNTFSGLLSSIMSATPLALTSIVNLPRILNEFVVVNLSLNFYNTTNESNLQTSSITDSRDNAVFTSENITSLDSVQTFNSSMSEISTSLRFTRFNNPLISYDYKCGNYLGI
jgi:hypothetical protein